MISVDWGDDSPIDLYCNNTIDNVVHVYPSPGSYEVTITVTDECGTTEKKGVIVLEASTCIPVTHVTKTSPFSTHVNVDLPLTISILPQNATNLIHSWHIVDDGGTGATIENNVFRATNVGTAIVEVRIENALCDGVTRIHAYPITVLEEIREPDDVPSTMKPPVFCLAPGTSIMSAAIFRTDRQTTSAWPNGTWNHTLHLDLVIRDIVNDLTYTFQRSLDMVSNSQEFRAEFEIKQVEPQMPWPRPFVDIMITVVHESPGVINGDFGELVIYARPRGYSNLTLLEQNDPIIFAASGISAGLPGIHDSTRTTLFPFINFNNTCEGTIPEGTIPVENVPCVPISRIDINASTPNQDNDVTLTASILPSLATDGDNDVEWSIVSRPSNSAQIHSGNKLWIGNPNTNSQDIGTIRVKATILNPTCIGNVNDQTFDILVSRNCLRFTGNASITLREGSALGKRVSNDTLYADTKYHLSLSGFATTGTADLAAATSWSFSDGAPNHPMRPGEPIIDKNMLTTGSHFGTFSIRAHVENVCDMNDALTFDFPVTVLVPHACPNEFVYQSNGRTLNQVDAATVIFTSPEEGNVGHFVVTISNQYNGFTVQRNAGRTGRSGEYSASIGAINDSRLFFQPPNMPTLPYTVSVLLVNIPDREPLTCCRGDVTHTTARPSTTTIRCTQ